MIKRKEKKLEGTDPGDSAVATCLSVHMIYIPFTPKVLIIEARNAKRSEIKITSRKSPGCVLWRERETLGKFKGQQSPFRPLEEELRKMTKKKRHQST